MIERIPVEIRLADGSRVSCRVEVRQDSNRSSWVLMLLGIELPRQEFAGPDLFEAMIEMRRMLEGERAQLLCAGARPEVFPSAMSRQMSGGRKAYSTTLGQPALSADLVDIFDYATPEIVGSVDQQLSFHAKWVESLGLR